MLIAFASALVALPQEAPRAEVAIVVARAVRQKFDDTEFNCPADFICMRYPATGRFDQARVLDGIALPRRFTPRLWLHGRLRSIRFAMIVERKPDGSLHILDYRFIDRSGKVCFATESLRHFRLTLPGAQRDEAGDSCAQI